MIYILSLLINIPNLIYCFYTESNYFVYFIYPVFLCCCLVYFFPKIVYFIFIFILPFSLFESFYIYKYKRVSDEQIYAIVRETNFSEAISWIGIYGLIGIIFAFGLALIFLLRYKKIEKNNISSKWSIIIIISNIAILISINLLSILDFIENNENNENIVIVKDGKYEIIGDDLIGHLNKSYFYENFPWGIPSRVGKYLDLNRGMSNAKNEISKFEFGATQDESRKDDVEIFVLVIGETGRPDRWSLNGYEKLTNPKLSKIKNLVSFSNVTTSWAWTRMSVPIIISRKPSNLKSSFFPEKSLVSVFKEAGFWTAWFSTQGALGFHESAVALHASEADEVRYINPVSYLASGAKDLDLMPFFKNALSYSHKKKFIVLHTLGSHFNYLDRITEDFEIFSPSLSGLKTVSLHNKSDKLELSNSYDNTIVYVDNFLSKLIEELNSKYAVASLLYIADHGENIFDNGCDKSGHGHNTDFDYRVAALWWGSSYFIEKYPEKMEYAKSMRYKPWATENVFESMLDISGIDVKNNPRENKSILNEDFMPSPRKLQSGFDFDNAPRGGECNVIGSS